MSSERTGRLEKWILIHAYLKTVKKEMPKGFKEGGHDRKGYRRDYYWNCLYRDEILLNYFNLEKSEKESLVSRQKFKDTKEYRSALVSLNRVLKRLSDKKLIENRYSVDLTDAGKLKAEKLLNVNS